MLKRTYQFAIVSKIQIFMNAIILIGFWLTIWYTTKACSIKGFVCFQSGASTFREDVQKSRETRKNHNKPLIRQLKST